ncbi:MBL fold metallo-hydrolase [Azospirillum picis]|uniref:Glyoxylase-like metal-dependent hydrolase (Beta-lactamase superfamily II) n=1 Tax=Azospirillum picis TaxID=488438 RepID=A0ABU0MNC2_9PROT|nr:MBL fold metallo-hydrolase [Azospirillum picis]MBP2301855.1 glyoxylase-like metal-dependent hydrolase (beta-lactamase superfamily II) [Azospirillum picis]MDQ0534970.1 glyoxylase-like metal-dependent hydrolase (beta-lactamase superfamily II) [Azospirillum picis]
MTRSARSALLALALLPATALSPILSIPAEAAAPQVRTQAPGFYRMMLGRTEITALLDGTHPFPIHEVVNGIGTASADALLERSSLAPPVEGSINAFLVNTGDRLVLIDSGAGVLYGADGGHLMANLRAAGYAPEQVDEIYLTHLHRDHVGGVDRSGSMAFPNAVIRVSRRDSDYWLDPANKATAPGFLGPMFDGAAASLKPYVAAGRLAPFDGETQLLPEIRAIPGPGHTPGHTIYQVRSDGQTLLAWGDIVHVAAIQFPYPAATLKYDSDEPDARRERERLFAEAARNGYWIAAAHISFPGLGHIRRDDQGYHWLPANYTTVMVPAAP